MIDLLSIATETEWSSGLISDGLAINNLQRIPWNSPPSRQEFGFAGVRTQNTEDGRSNRVLHLHPRWNSQGFVSGVFPILTLPERALFRSSVGFLEGATGTNGVIFEVWESHWELFDAGPNHYRNRLASYHKTYTHGLMPFQVDLSHLSGKEVQIEIRVLAAGNPGQDWAAILNPRVESGQQPTAQILNIQATQLQVVVANETRPIEGRGDEPYLGAIYVRSIGGVRGSTKVVVLDDLKTLGNNISQSSTISIGLDAGLGIVDLVSHRDRFGIMGLFFVAMEEDRRGKSTVREVLRDTARKMEECFRTYIEQRQNWWLESEQIERDLSACVLGNGHHSGGGLFTGKFIDSAKKWLFRGDDEIGQAKLLFISGPEDILRDRMPSGTFLVPPSGASQLVMDFYARIRDGVTTFIGTEAPPVNSRPDQDRSKLQGHYRVTVQVNTLTDGRLTL